MISKSKSKSRSENLLPMLLPDNEAAGLSAVEFSLVSVEVAHEATGSNHCVRGINWLEKF